LGAATGVGAHLCNSWVFSWAFMELMVWYWVSFSGFWFLLGWVWMDEG
jgi:hypothetical protein